MDSSKGYYEGCKPPQEDVELSIQFTVKKLTEEDRLKDYSWEISVDVFKISGTSDILKES